MLTLAVHPHASSCITLWRYIGKSQMAEVRLEHSHLVAVISIKHKTNINIYTPKGNVCVYVRVFCRGWVVCVWEHARLCVRLCEHVRVLTCECASLSVSASVLESVCVCTCECV